MVSIKNLDRFPISEEEKKNIVSIYKLSENKIQLLLLNWDTKTVKSSIPVKDENINKKDCCSIDNSKVTNSRWVGVHSIRRRRTCLTCWDRFTTYESSIKSFYDLDKKEKKKILIDFLEKNI